MQLELWFSSDFGGHISSQISFGSFRHATYAKSSRPLEFVSLPQLRLQLLYLPKSISTLCICWHCKVSNTSSKVTAQCAFGQNSICSAMKMQLLLQTGFTRTLYAVGAHSGKLLPIIGVPSWPPWPILNRITKFDIFASVVTIPGLMVL